MSIATVGLPSAQSVYVARSGPGGHSYLAMPIDTIGSRLRAYRRRKGWSQTRLAHESGVTRQAIAEMERGKVTIPREPKNVKALARALDISMEDLARPTGWYDDVDPHKEWMTGMRTDPRLDETDRSIIEIIVRKAYDSGDPVTED